MKKKIEKPQLYCDCGNKVLKKGKCVECKIKIFEKKGKK